MTDLNANKVIEESSSKRTKKLGGRNRIYQVEGLEATEGVGSPSTTPAPFQGYDSIDDDEAIVRSSKRRLVDVEKDLSDDTERLIGESSRKLREQADDDFHILDQAFIFNPVDGLETGNSEKETPEGAGFHSTHPVTYHQENEFQARESKSKNDAEAIVDSSEKRVVEIENMHEDILHKVMVETGVEVHIAKDAENMETEGVGSSSTTPAYSMKVSRNLIKCVMCGKTFPKVTPLLSHIKKVHKSNASNKTVIKAPPYTTKMPDLADPEFYEKFMAYYNGNSGAYKRVSSKF